MTISLHRFIATLFAVTGVVTLNSCQKDIDMQEDAVSAKTIKDVRYGTNALQGMDIYLPANRSTANTPVLVLVHGGAWIGGDKSEFDGAVEIMRKELKEYAIFNINYRLVDFSGVVSWPEPLNDVDTSISFIRRKASEYQYNADKLVMIGASSGAHLSLLKAYGYNQDKHIKAVVNLFGPVDITDLYNRPPDPGLPLLLSFFMNGTPASNAPAYLAASPLYQVTAASPPTISFHGTVDELVPAYQSDSLYNRLTKAGVPCDLVKYTGEGHGWTGNNLTDTYSKAVAFIRKHVK